MDWKHMNTIHRVAMVLCGLVLAAPSSLPAAAPDPADKPVRVFILLGQSNMVGAGKVKGGKEGCLDHAVKEEKLYPFLIDDAGHWAARDDVRYVRFMSGKLLNNGWLAVGGGKIGHELGIGHALGEALDDPVMILKCCIGNRSLDWDLLPPGSESYEAMVRLLKGHGNPETNPPMP